MQQELNLVSAETGQVLLLIDWENLWYGLLHRFNGDPEEMNISRRISGLMNWVQGMGGPLGGHGFVFAPDHLPAGDRENCFRKKLQVITCSKKYVGEGKLNEKKGDTETIVDTVDDTIIWYARMMVGHPNFKTLCLVSGNNDYVPLFEQMGHLNIKRALAAPSFDSMAKPTQGKILVDLVDRDPLTNERLLLMLDKV